MLNILFSPNWFYGKDILIDIVSVIVLGLISGVTFNYYRCNRQKKEHLCFSIASFLLSLSFLFKILTNFTLYTHVLKTQQFGFLTFTYQTIQYSDTLFLAGTLLYRLFTLIGFYLLFLIYYPKQSKPSVFFMIYLLIIATYFTSQTYYIIHVTTFLFLIFLVKKYYDNSLKTKDRPAKLILWSFLIISASQLIFIFMGIEKIFYVVAESVQLVGYVLLLISLLMVHHYGRKKIKI